MEDVVDKAKLYVLISIFQLIFNFGVFIFKPNPFGDITSSVISTVGVAGAGLPFVSFVGFIGVPNMDLLTMSLMSSVILIFSCIQLLIISSSIWDAITDLIP